MTAIQASRYAAEQFRQKKSGAKNGLSKNVNAIAPRSVIFCPRYFAIPFVPPDESAEPRIPRITQRGLRPQLKTAETTNQPNASNTTSKILLCVSMVQVPCFICGQIWFSDCRP